MRKSDAGWLFGLLSLFCLNAVGGHEAATRPAVRTISACVCVSDTTDGPLRKALEVQADAKAALEPQCCAAETVRSASPPLAERVAGKSDVVALALLQRLDDLGDSTARASQYLFNTPLHARP